MSAKFLSFKIGPNHTTAFKIPIQHKSKKPISDKYKKHVENNYRVQANGTIWKVEKEQKPVTNGTKSKYLKIMICFEGEFHSFYLHRVVFFSFHPHLNTEANAKLQVDHKNGKHTDCRISNLRLVEAKENNVFKIKRLKALKAKRQNMTA